MPSRIQRLDNLAYIRQKKIIKEPASDAGDASTVGTLGIFGGVTVTMQQRGKIYSTS